MEQVGWNRGIESVPMSTKDIGTGFYIGMIGKDKFLEINISVV